jgi:1-acyl-sn-glycerol-3-phosphate acyltransferase
MRKDSTAGAILKKLWYRLLSQILTFLYYHRVRVLNSQHLPVDCPVLYVALHRNGAVDGYVYKSLLPRISFLISVQLRRRLFGRIFFEGIEIARAKDRVNGAAAAVKDSNAVIDACADYLGQGGELLILPEGTSDLGHCHLPFHKGAARTVARFMERHCSPLAVVPVGIHYEQAWAWQSDVEVVVGAPIDTTLPAKISAAEGVRVLHKRIISALEALAVQAPDGETFARRERIAFAATLGSKRSYFAALKALESGLPEAEALTEKLEKALRNDLGGRLWLYHGVPLVPMNYAWAYPLLFGLLFPFTALASVLNAPPLIAANWAGRRCSDGQNTIALWRLLIGFPALVIWAGLLLFATVLTHASTLWIAYLAVSIMGLISVRRVQKLAVSLHNWLLAAPLRRQLLDWRAHLEGCMRARNV